MEQLRIVQHGKEEFTVEKKIKENRIVKSYWFWNIRKDVDVWKGLNRRGDVLSIYNILNEPEDANPLKTLEEAVEWTKEYVQYPIYYDIIIKENLQNV